MEIEWHPSGRQLRVFGVSGLLASILAAVILHFVWGVSGLWALAVVTAGTGIFVCSLLSPAATRAFYVGLTLVAMPIGVVVSFVLLAVFYFLLLTPLAMVFRLIGRDSLCRKYEPDAESYWVEHKPSDDMERYLHPF
ncbi:MAG: hypothetical protein ABFE13_07730 [Phycisphaerales bacterium]